MKHILRKVRRPTKSKLHLLLESDRRKRNIVIKCPERVDLDRLGEFSMFKRVIDGSVYEGLMECV
jgi:hypothetical protein